MTSVISWHNFIILCLASFCTPKPNWPVIPCISWLPTFAFQEMERVNINILGVSELKWTVMGEFNSDDHYIYFCGQESLRRNGVAIIGNKRVWNAVLGCSLKNARMISVHFQGKQYKLRIPTKTWLSWFLSIWGFLYNFWKVGYFCCQCVSLGVGTKLLPVLELFIL